MNFAQFESHPRWPMVLKVLNTLRARGFQALLVGGAVRDALLGRELKDFDVVTDAHPEEVEASFANTLALGKAFGVISVVLDRGFQVEVATFRSDGDYNEFRHPKKVSFTGIEVDASRRDFTINALYFDPIESKLFDFFSGKSDLASKQIKAIGNPELRFKEDPLRMLRAVRFASQLNFKIESETARAILKSSMDLHRVSRERIGNEMKSILNSRNWALGVFLLKELGLWSGVFPNLKGIETSFSKTELETLPQAGWVERLAWIFLECAPNVLVEQMRSLKASSQDIGVGEFLIKNAPLVLDETLRLGKKLELLELAPWPEFFNFIQGYCVLKKIPLKAFEELTRRFSEIAGKDGHLPRALVDGRILMAEGLESGAEMGRILKEIYYLQIEGEFTSLDQAKTYIRKSLHTSSEV